MQRRWAKQRTHALAKRAAAEHKHAGAKQQQAGEEPDETEAATSSDYMLMEESETSQEPAVLETETRKSARPHAPSTEYAGKDWVTY